MTPEDLIRRYPRLYHMAAAGSWPSISTHGLLSTSALLDLFEISGPERASIELERRPESVVVKHPKRGRALIRDQKPLTTSALQKCLDGMTVEEWFRLLNGRVFLWLTETRLATMVGARPYRDRPHTVLVVDTARLVAAHATRIQLSPINSGSTIYNPAPRGAQTFSSIEGYPFDKRRTRGPNSAIVELCVKHSIPDIGEHVTLVYEREASGVENILFQRA